MTAIPTSLRETIPEHGLSIAESWWSGLSDSERDQIEGLWDNRLEVKFFTPQSDEGGLKDEWKNVPRVSGGRFVPSDDTSGRSDWEPGYFEHLLQHPELVMAYDPTVRTFFFFCTQHPFANQCRQNGEVPTELKCPLSSTSCPLISLRGSKLTSCKA